MVSLDLFSINIIVGLLILTPGFLFFKLSIYFGNIKSTFSRFEQVIWSLIGTGVCLSLLYTLYILPTFFFQGEVEPVPIELSLLQISKLYLPLLIIAIILGFSTGWILEQYFPDFSLRRDFKLPLWGSTISDLDGYRMVRVVTVDNKEIRGYLQRTGSHASVRDVLILYPRVMYRKNGEIKSTNDVGEYVYIRENNIARIFFEEENDK